MIRMFVDWCCFGVTVAVRVAVTVAVTVAVGAAVRVRVHRVSCICTTRRWLDPQSRTPSYVPATSAEWIPANGWTPWCGVLLL